MLAFTKEPWLFLLLANVLMLFVGCFLEPTAAITILVPILPDRAQTGHQPGAFRSGDGAEPDDRFVHPPMGMVLFVLARVAKLSVERTTTAILPWLVPLLISLVILTYIPAIGLWLPKYMGCRGEADIRPFTNAVILPPKAGIQCRDEYCGDLTLNGKSRLQAENDVA